MTDNTVNEKELQETPGYVRELLRKKVAELIARTPDLDNNEAAFFYLNGVMAVCRYEDFLLINEHGELRDPSYRARFAELSEEVRDTLCRQYAGRPFMARANLGLWWVNNVELDCTIRYLERK